LKSRNPSFEAEKKNHEQPKSDEPSHVPAVPLAHDCACDGGTDSDGNDFDESAPMPSAIRQRYGGKMPHMMPRALAGAEKILDIDGRVWRWGANLKGIALGLCRPDDDYLEYLREKRTMSKEPDDGKLPAQPPPDPIPDHLQIALFKIFWTWLAIVGSVVVVVAAG